MTSALYEGVVAHVRHRPRRHRLRYRVMQGLFELDELPDLSRRLRLFGHNRPAAVSFHDRDHGDGSGDLRGWVQAELRGAGITGPWGAVRVLCMPRILGYVFNPLSVYFCHDLQGRLAALLYEVNNTFGGRHAYVMAAPSAGPVRQSCAKAFHVSPFLQMGLTYAFHVSPPAAAVGIRISAADETGTVLDASFAGHRRALTDRALARALVAYPAMTLKVILGIHWEALKLWLGGVAFAPAPERPRSASDASARP
jgi:DUF1365 family protein